MTTSTAAAACRALYPAIEVRDVTPSMVAPTAADDAVLTELKRRQRRRQRRRRSR